MAWSALSKALPGRPKVKEIDQGNGKTSLFIGWDDGAAAYIEIVGDTARWLQLSHLRLMEACHDAVRDVFPSQGIKRLLAAPADAKARKALMANGDWHEIETPEGPMLEWVLDGD